MFIHYETISVHISGCTGQKRALVPGGDWSPADVCSGKQPPTKWRRDEGDRLLAAATAAPWHQTCDVQSMEL